ncbi:MAG: cobalamin B12-binding domain-containing protein [bacterium]|nr:cobalamin B12-binding domain-containing protein [bacterium]
MSREVNLMHRKINRDRKFVLGASIGNCVHVAGVIHFLQLAEDEGYETEFIGPATSIDQLFERIEITKPDIVGVGYRLTPENVVPLLKEIDERRKRIPFRVKWVFGGTKPVADIAREYNFFSFISDGFDDINDSIRFLRGLSQKPVAENFGSNLVSRINASYPYPILRHHFGRPSLRETVEGIKEIAEAKVLDVISIGPDQNAQQFFFHPEKMSEDFTGAGGVPLRTRKDFVGLKVAAQQGNFPLMRCYSGTEDVFRYAEMLKETIDNAWAAIPLCWYNELDGRGTRTVEQSMAEALNLMKWHAERNIPVECNEPHHWGLRDAHDVIPVAMAYIAAYNAKKCGVTHYISQYMFNNPNGLSFSMDLAKVLAMMEMVEDLEDDTFHIYRETRAGLALFSADEAVAKGQLAASTFMQMVVRPHIMHVVGYCEADHAARAGEVIESCRIVKGVIRHTLNDDFSIAKDKKIVKRKEELIREAKYLISFIIEEYASYEDPIGTPDVLCDCIHKGYIDAVHIKKDERFTGDLKTKIVNGCCVAVNPEDGRIMSEKERLDRLKDRYTQLIGVELNYDEKLRKGTCNGGRASRSYNGSTFIA